MHPTTSAPPPKTLLLLAWATFVGLAGGLSIGVAIGDLDSATRMRQAFLACPEAPQADPHG